MLRWLVAGGLIAACRSFPDRVEPDYGSTPTDTFPSFYGRVPRNLVMISIDTLRRDHVDRYAPPGAPPTMPFLSRLADTGVALDDFAQCSNWTFASVSCTLAGRYNFEAGMAPQIGDEERQPWPDGTPFLAGHLRDLGFFNLLVSTNGWLSDEWGNDQGYQDWFFPRDASLLGAFYEGRERLRQYRERGIADRWHLHLHAIEPHAEYDPPVSYLEALNDLPPARWDLVDRDQHYALRDDWPALPAEDQALLEAHLRARYRAEARWLDDQLFVLFQALETTGMLDDALLVIWTDHGEAFWEHGWHTHAFTLHGEETDGVALFWAKNIVPGVVTAPTSGIDLAPTLLKLWTGEVPPPMTGIPVGDVTEDRARFLWTVARLGSGQAIEQNGWKLIFPWVGPRFLYDRRADPQERVNLYDAAAPRPEAFALWAELEPKVREAAALLPERRVNWPTELEPAP